MLETQQNTKQIYLFFLQRNVNTIFFKCLENVFGFLSNSSAYLVNAIGTYKAKSKKRS